MEAPSYETVDSPRHNVTDASFAILWHDTSPRLLSLPTAVTGRRDVAEELTQEAFLRLASNKEAQRYEKPEAWLRRVVLNLAIDHTRRSGVRLEQLRESPPEDPRQVKDIGDVAVERDWIWSLVGELPDRERSALILKYAADLSIRDVAAALDCPVGTAKSHLSRGRSRLRVLLATQARGMHVHHSQRKPQP